MIKRLAALLLPTNRELPELAPMSQRAVELTSRTSLDFAVVFWPMVLEPELVRRQLSDRTSNVNDPLVPTVTLPVILVVTLLKVLVAPSATSCARRAGTASSVTAKTDVTMKRNDAMRRIPMGFQHST